MDWKGGGGQGEEGEVVGGEGEKKGEVDEG